jgi:hypothetical protein
VTIRDQIRQKRALYKISESSVDNKLFLRKNLIQLSKFLRRAL